METKYRQQLVHTEDSDPHVMMVQSFRTGSDPKSTAGAVKPRQELCFHPSLGRHLCTWNNASASAILHERFQGVSQPRNLSKAVARRPQLWEVCQRNEGISLPVSVFIESRCQSRAAPGA